MSITNWKRTTLGDIAKQEYGLVDGPFGSNLPASSYTDRGVPVIRGSNLSLGQIRFWDKEFVYVSEETAQRLSRSICSPGDIIFTKKGTLGQTGIIPQNYKYSKFLLSSNQMKLSVDDKKADSIFVYYFVSSPLSQEKIVRDASVAGVPKTNLAYLRTFPIHLPSLFEQRKIASILSAYDDLIENNTRRIQILEEMARMIYREWFVNFRFPGYKKAKFVESPLGRIPEGWQITHLGEIAEDSRRGVQPESVHPDTPYIGLEHIPRRSIALSEWGKVTDVQSTKLIFRKGEILFGKIRPYFHKVAVAPIDGICSSDAIVISAKRDALYPLTLMCVSSDEFVQHATQTSNGTKMPRANWGVLLSYPVLVPPDTVLQPFSESIFNILKQIQNLVFRNRNLQKTRDLLLPKLISGQIDVSDLDIQV